LRKVYDFEFNLLEAIINDSLPPAVNLPASGPG